MKNFALCFIAAAIFSGCGSVQSQQATNSNKVVKESKARLGNLTEEQKQKLDQRIPPEVREILDKAEEFTILYDIDKETMKLNVLPQKAAPNANANVADPAVKKEFLDSFYVDAADNSNGASCFSPRQRINAKYQSKVVEIDICYECSRFRGTSPTGDFGGAMDFESQSEALIDAIIEKYGKKIK